MECVSLVEILERGHPYCKCGCSQRVDTPGAEYLKGHYFKTKEARKLVEGGPVRERAAKSMRSRWTTDRKHMEEVCLKPLRCKESEERRLMGLAFARKGTAMEVHRLIALRSDEVRNRISASLMGRRQSEETCEAKSRALTGRVLSSVHKDGIGNAQRKSWAGLSPAGYRERCRIATVNSHKSFSGRGEDYNRGLSLAMKDYWANVSEEEATKRLRKSGFGASKRPNRAEVELLEILEICAPGKFKYNGTGEVRIGRRIPDFIGTDGIKKVVELFGIHWHDPVFFPEALTEEEKVSFYKERGYDCLVIWEDEVHPLNMELVQKILGFTNLVKGGGSHVA